jgi:hypothetical protein
MNRVMKRLAAIIGLSIWAIAITVGVDIAVVETSPRIVSAIEGPTCYTIDKTAIQLTTTCVRCNWHGHFSWWRYPDGTVVLRWSGWRLPGVRATTLAPAGATYIKAEYRTA